MKNMKKILCAVLSFVMLLGLTACGGTDTSAETETPSTESESAATGKIAEIQEKGQLVLGTASGYPPFEFVSMENNGAVIGIDVELAQAIADKLGVELVVQDMPFGELIMNLNSGVCDIVIAGLPETPERAEMADFSMVYVNDEQTIIVRAEDADKYTSLEDFAGKTVDVELGASSETVAREELTGANINALSLIADCFMELSQGKCDAVVTGMVVGKQYVVNNDAYAELADLDFVNKDKPTQACIAKGAPEFLELVNEVIKENQDNGNFDKWIDQYSAQASKEAQG